jgi:hypothetical protein
MFARRGACLCAALAALAWGAGDAPAGFTFKAITNNNPADTVIGEAQLSVEVEAAGTAPSGNNQVIFTFLNSGPLASSITDIYFDDGELLAMGAVTDSGGGVSFSPGASPGNLPGGNPIGFNSTVGRFFSLDSNSPTQPMGVNPGEWVSITFELQEGRTYDHVLAAMDLSLNNPGVDMVGGLRIGIHVQGFASGGSESFVNGGSPPAVPAPPTVIMVGIGMLGLGGWTRLRRKFAKAKSE